MFLQPGRSPLAPIHCGNKVTASRCGPQRPLKVWLLPGPEPALPRPSVAHVVAPSVCLGVGLRMRWSGVGCAVAAAVGLANGLCGAPEPVPVSRQVRVSWAAVLANDGTKCPGAAALHNATDEHAIVAIAGKSTAAERALKAIWSEFGCKMKPVARDATISEDAHSAELKFMTR